MEISEAEEKYQNDVFGIQNFIVHLLYYTCSVSNL